MVVVLSIVVAFGLGIHIFESTMKIGANQADLSSRHILACGGLFGGLQILMMLGGFLTTWLVEKYLNNVVVNKIFEYVIIICLFLIIIRELHECRSIKELQESRSEPLSWKQWALRALGMGFVAVIVGMSMTYLTPGSIWNSVCIMAVGMVSSILGLWYGYWIGVRGWRAFSFCSAALLGVAEVFLILC